MRFIMIDYARQQNARKRGGDQVKVSLDEVGSLAQMEATDLLALNAALERLAHRDQRLAQVVKRKTGGCFAETSLKAPSRFTHQYPRLPFTALI